MTGRSQQAEAQPGTPGPGAAVPAAGTAQAPEAPSGPATTPIERVTASGFPDDAGPADDTEPASEAEPSGDLQLTAPSSDADLADDTELPEPSDSADPAGTAEAAGHPELTEPSDDAEPADPSAADAQPASDLELTVPPDDAGLTDPSAADAQPAGDLELTRPPDDADPGADLEHTDLPDDAEPARTAGPAADLELTGPPDDAGPSGEDVPAPADVPAPVADAPAATVADPSGDVYFAGKKLPDGALLSNRYRLGPRIAAGGMGEVWRATDELLGRPVAVKLLSARHANDEQFRTRFRAEARYAASLSHPGIAQVYDYAESDTGSGGDGSASRVAYLVMELVEGEALSATIARDAPMPPATVLDLVAQAARALAVAHAAGIVHRDIKPGNLLIRPDGQVKITDFGIARAVVAAKLTQTGMVMGTAQYVSPEQASARPVTAASDIYSLGVVAYECLAGQPPFTAQAPIALALAHVSNKPPALPSSVPPRVAALVGQMLAKEPANRPASAEVVADRASTLLGTTGLGTTGWKPGQEHTGSGEQRTVDAAGDGRWAAAGDGPWIIEPASPATWFSDPTPTAAVAGTGTAPIPAVAGRRTGSRPAGRVFATVAVLAAILVAGTIALLAATRHPAATLPGKSNLATHQARPSSRHPVQATDQPPATTFPVRSVTPSPDKSPSPTGSPSTSPSPTSSPSASSTPPSSPPTSPPPTSPPPTSPTPTPTDSQANPPPAEAGILRIPNTIMQDG